MAGGDLKGSQARFYDRKEPPRFQELIILGPFLRLTFNSFSNAQLEKYQNTCTEETQVCQVGQLLLNNNRIIRIWEKR